MRITHPTELEMLADSTKEPFIALEIDGMTDLDVFYMTELKFIKELKDHLYRGNLDGFDDLLKRHSACSYSVLLHILHEFIIHSIGSGKTYASDKDRRKIELLLKDIETIK